MATLEKKPDSSSRMTLTLPSDTEVLITREIAAPRRLVYTFEYEPMAGRILTEALTFEDRGDRTLVVNRSKYASKADRDVMLASGMEEGAAETLHRLEEQALLSGDPRSPCGRLR